MLIGPAPSEARRTEFITRRAVLRVKGRLPDLAALPYRRRGAECLVCGVLPRELPDFGFSTARKAVKEECLCQRHF